MDPTYDQEHNLTGYNGSAFAYDWDHHLFSATNGTSDVESRYDGLGRCVSRTVNGALTYFFYDGWNPILETNSAGAQTAARIYGPGADEIIEAFGSSGSSGFFYHQNNVGNVTGLTDSLGNVVEQYGYDEFGHTQIYNASGKQIATSAYGNRFMFQGREYLASVNVYDFRSRAYSPDLGRFLQMDPIGFGGGNNLYGFVGNNPVSGRDPSGLIPGYLPPAQSNFNPYPVGALFDPWSQTTTGLPTGVSGIIGELVGDVTGLQALISAESVASINPDGSISYPGGDGPLTVTGYEQNTENGAASLFSAVGSAGVSAWQSLIRWLPHGLGVSVGEQTDIGFPKTSITKSSLGQNGSVGVGTFFNDNGSQSFGAYAAGGFFSNDQQVWGFPKSANPWSVGWYYGAGLSPFLTNATSVSQLSGPFDTYSLNLGFLDRTFSAQLSVGGGIWMLSYGGIPMPGVGIGAAYSQYPTNTVTFGP